MYVFICCFSLYLLSYSIVANLALVYSSLMPVLICVLLGFYQPRPHLVDRGTTARYGGQLRYI